MPKRESMPITRAHVWLFVDDLRWLKDTYGAQLGVAKAVRTIVRSFRLKVEARQQEVLDTTPDLDVNLGDLAREHEQSVG